DATCCNHGVCVKSTPTTPSPFVAKSGDAPRGTHCPRIGQPALGEGTVCRFPVAEVARLPGSERPGNLATSATRAHGPQVWRLPVPGEDCLPLALPACCEKSDTTAGIGAERMREGWAGGASFSRYSCFLRSWRLFALEDLSRMPGTGIIQVGIRDRATSFEQV